MLFLSINFSSLRIICGGFFLSKRIVSFDSWRVCSNPLQILLFCLFLILVPQSFKERVFSLFSIFGFHFTRCYWLLLDEAQIRFFASEFISEANLSSGRSYPSFLQIHTFVSVCLRIQRLGFKRNLVQKHVLVLLILNKLVNLLCQIWNFEFFAKFNTGKETLFEVDLVKECENFLPLVFHDTNSNRLDAPLVNFSFQIGDSLCVENGLTKQKFVVIFAPEVLQTFPILLSKHFMLTLEPPIEHVCFNFCQ